MGFFVPAGSYVLEATSGAGETTIHTSSYNNLGNIQFTTAKPGLGMISKPYKSNR